MTTAVLIMTSAHLQSCFFSKSVTNLVAHFQRLFCRWILINNNQKKLHVKLDNYVRILCTFKTFEQSHFNEHLTSISMK